MSARVTVRQLRNEFPKVKRRVKPGAKDYLARLRRHQPRPLSAALAEALHDENRGSR